MPGAFKIGCLKIGADRRWPLKINGDDDEDEDDDDDDDDDDDEPVETWR